MNTAEAQPQGVLRATKDREIPSEPRPFSGRLSANAPLELVVANLAIVGQALACAELQLRLPLSYCSATGPQMSPRASAPNESKAPRYLKPNITRLSHARASLVEGVSKPAAAALAPCGKGRPTDLKVGPTKRIDIELNPTPLIPRIFPEMEMWLNQLLATEALFGQSLLFVLFGLIQNVIQLVRKHASQRPAIQFICTFALVRPKSRLHRALHALAEDRTEGLHLPVHHRAIRQGAPLRSSFINPERLERVKFTIPFEVNHHQVREGVPGLHRFQWFPIQFDGLATPDFSEFGFQCVDDFGFGVTFIEGDNKRHGFEQLRGGRLAKRRDSRLTR